MEYNILHTSFLTNNFLQKFLPDINMAVPKKKTSKSRRNQRRSHDALSKINIIIDKNTGEYRLPHHLDISNGEYRNRQVIVAKKPPSEE